MVDLAASALAGLRAPMMRLEAPRERYLTAASRPRPAVPPVRTMVLPWKEWVGSTGGYHFSLRRWRKPAMVKLALSKVFPVNRNDQRKGDVYDSKRREGSAADI